MIFTVDIGTTILKAALFDGDGTLLKKGERAIKLIPGEDPVFHESDAGTWISAFETVIAQLEITPGSEIDAVVVSGNGPTLLPVGFDDMPVDNAMMWMDRRATKESEEVSELTGFYVDPTFYLPKAYWVFRNKPKVYKKTKYFFSCGEYLNYLLTGNPHTILPVPEYREYIWTEPLVNSLGMDWDKFPGFYRPADFLGKTTKTAEARFHFPAGVPVFAGGPDFIVSLIGTGTVFPGRVCDRSGTSEGINLCTDTLVEDRRLICVSHIIEGLYNISGIISTSGKAVEWFKNVTERNDIGYEEFFHSIDSVRPGSDRLLFLPYLAGERAPIWDPDARGAFIGLTLNHTNKEMTRAVIESVGYAIRHVIAVMEEMGLNADELRITGSQAKSPVWNQIKADITGKILLVPEMKESELAGNLAIGFYGLKKHKTLAEAAEKVVVIEKEYAPNKKNKDIYDDLFFSYLESYKGLKNVFSRLSGNNKKRRRQ